MADKLWSLYKLPSTADAGPSQLVPWVMGEGTREKLPVTSIFMRVMDGRYVLCSSVLDYNSLASGNSGLILPADRVTFLTVMFCVYCSAWL